MMFRQGWFLTGDRGDTCILAFAAWVPWSEACPRPKPNWPGRNLLADACSADGDEDPERDETGHAGPAVTHRGSVQGNSPGCLSEYQSPEHSEFDPPAVLTMGDGRSRCTPPFRGADIEESGEHQHGYGHGYGDGQPT